MTTIATSTRALARVVAVCAVLAGLFLMHGLATQECHGGAGASASSMSTMPAATGGVVKPVEAMVHGSLNGSARHSTSTDGADAAPRGGLCVSTPPTLGLAGLLALLLAVGGLVLPSAVPRPNRATPSTNHGRGPPLAGSALLMNLCVCRR
ncbi:MAG: DUF6153 family protein [Pseudonocardiaceae bacterium]